MRLSQIWTGELRSTHRALAPGLAPALLASAAWTGALGVETPANSSGDDGRPASAEAAEKRSPPSRSVIPDVVHFQLENGLTVLVHEDRRLPLVHVTAGYSVGGAHEKPGITGLAHYVEHMAFRSTENLSNSDLTGVIERIGGRWNGYTSLDLTVYGATVPSWALESVLHIEAERMSRVLFAPDEFERERTSVIAELQGGVSAQSVLRERVTAHAFEAHPYRTGIIGQLTDLLSVTVEEGEEFYRSYYGPNNAVLVIAGDVDPTQVRELVIAYFGEMIPAPRSTEIRVIEPHQLGEKRLEVTYPSSAPHLRIAYRAPEATDPDYASLMVLDAVLTGNGGLLQVGGAAAPGSRLHRAVIEAGGSSVSTGYSPTRYPALYSITGRAVPGADLHLLEDAIHREVERIATEGVPAFELEEAARHIRTGAQFERSNLRETAHRLLFFQLMGSWQMADVLLEDAVTRSSADLQAYARAWLQRHQRTVGHQHPGPDLSPPVHVPPPAVEPIVIPDPSPVPERALRPLPAATLHATREALANGIRLHAVEHDGPIGALHLRLAFGSTLDPAGQEGLAFLAGRALTEHPLLEDLRQRLGIRVESSTSTPFPLSNREYLDLSIRFLPEHLEEVSRGLADALRSLHGGFGELKALRRSHLADLDGWTENSRWRAQEAVLSRVDPAWRPPVGTPASLERITSDDLDRFLAEALTGGNMILALAAPDAPRQARSVLRPILELIPAGAPVAGPAGRTGAKGAPEATPTSLGDGETLLIPLEGHSQTAVVAGLPGVKRSHPDYLPLQLLNYLLGETGYAGRLGMALVKNGLAYSVYATSDFDLEGGAILIRTSTATATLEATLDAIGGVVASFENDGVEMWEFREAQAFRIGRLLADLETSASLARLLAEGEFFGESPLDLPARSQQILDLTPTRVAEAARRHLRVGAMVLATAGAMPAGSAEESEEQRREPKKGTNGSHHETTRDRQLIP